MREMQAMAYEARNKKYLLIKAPPASGKSCALMFVALDEAPGHQEGGGGRVLEHVNNE